MGARGPKAKPRVETPIGFSPEHYDWLKAQGRPMSKVIGGLIDAAIVQERKAMRRSFRYWPIKPADVADETLREAISAAARECWDFSAYQVEIDGGRESAVIVRIRDDRRWGVERAGTVEWFGTLSPDGVEREIDAWLNGTEYLAPA